LVRGVIARSRSSGCNLNAFSSRVGTMTGSPPLISTMQRRTLLRQAPDGNGFGEGLRRPAHGSSGQPFLRGPHVVGDDGDGVVEPHDLPHAVDCLGRSVIEASRRRRDPSSP